MSYILDALNKAEQSRKQQLEPVSKTTSAQVSPSAEPRSNLVYLIGFGLVVAALLIWFLVPSAEQSNPVKIAETVTPTVIPMNTPTLKVVTPTPAEVITTEPAKMEAPAPSEPPSLPTLSQLPSEILASLPAIKISAHTYADDAAKRMVIINDKVMHEMRHISAALLLREITLTGVILAYDGIAFSMTAFDTWPY